jgi:hypothetical protein
MQNMQEHTAASGLLHPCQVGNGKLAVASLPSLAHVLLFLVLTDVGNLSGNPLVAVAATTFPAAG